MQLRMAPGASASLLTMKADTEAPSGTPVSVRALADGASLPSTASAEEGSLVASSRSSDGPSGEGSGSGTGTVRDGDGGPSAHSGRAGGYEALDRDGPSPTSEEIPHVDVDFVVRRLSSSFLPLTGQVVAYGWEQAAMLAARCRAMPNQLFTALWPATAACLDTFAAQVCGGAVGSARWVGITCGAPQGEPRVEEQGSEPPGRGEATLLLTPARDCRRNKHMGSTCPSIHGAPSSIEPRPHCTCIRAFWTCSRPGRCCKSAVPDTSACRVEWWRAWSSGRCPL